VLPPGEWQDTLSTARWTGEVAIEALLGGSAGVALLMRTG
jgi:hypothetical protein